MFWGIRKKAGLEPSSKTVESAVSEIYFPILRGYFIVYLTYYAIMLVLNWMSMPVGADFATLQSVTVIAVCLASYFAWRIRSSGSALMTEYMLLAMNSAVVLNVYVALNVGFLPEKLTYFIIMAMLFALASTSFRQSFLAITLSFIAMGSFANQLDNATLVAYGYLTFATSMSSLAIAFYLRKAISRIAIANIKARDELLDAEKMSSKLREVSLSDSLTELPNRRAFFGQFNRLIGEESVGTVAKADQRPLGWLILIDLDGFKAVNDIHGHLVGDQLLIAVANRLGSFCEGDTHISRMGGDEFNMIVSGDVPEDVVVRRCKHLLDDVAKPYLVDDRQVLISCSVGCVRCEPGQGVEAQISKADYALMAAKKQGKNRIVVFDKSHEKQSGIRFRIENALRGANLDQEIHVVFQPQFRLGTNEIVGAEVLARWTNPEVGPVPPQRFIQIAEESGLVANITLVVVRKAMVELSSWTSMIPISINLSGHDLLSDPVIDAIIEIIFEHRVDPTLVEFEVTETAMMADMQKAAANLERLSGLGFSIALDDFGTGYSNFNYLRSLPIERLKVDKSFVENPGDPMAEKILASLVGMARVLEVNCLLEGVEDEISLIMAKRAGAQFVQGYLLGKPMNADELMRMVAKNTTRGDVARIA